MSDTFGSTEKSESNTIHVLFVTTWFPTEEKPGSGPFVFEQAKAVQNQGINVKILQIRPLSSSKLFHTRYHHRWIDGIEVLSVFVESIAAKLLHFIYPWLTRQADQAYERYFADFNPDLIHGQVIYPAGFVASKMASDRNVPLHLSEHWSQSPDFLNKPFWGHRANKIYRSTHATYPVSHWLKDALQQTSPSPLPLNVIPNVVNPELFHLPHERQSQSPDTPIKLLCVMSFRHGLKRPDLLFDALSKLSPEQQSRFQITCIGSHQIDSPLAKRITCMDLNCELQLHGPQSKPSVARAMREADFLVHPSELETFGLVIAEALSCGTPVICSRVGALPELVSNKSGVLVPTNTISSWQKALTQLLEEPQEYNHQQIAEAAQQKCSPIAVGTKLVDQYRESVTNQQ